MDGFFWHNYIQFVHSTCHAIYFFIFDRELDRSLTLDYLFIWKSFKSILDDKLNPYIFLFSILH